MSSNISTRLAKKEDYNAILELSKQLYQVKKTEHYVPLTLENLEKMLENDFNHLHVATVGETIVAILHSVLRHTVGQGLTLRIDEMVVDRAFQGQNIGKMLLDELNSFAEERKINVLEVTVGYENRPAREFYLKNGFKQDGVQLTMHV